MSTVVFIISIDSGKGTLKFMGKFLREEGGQQVHDVTLIAHAAETLESFQIFNEMFSSYQAEIKRIEAKGIIVDGKHFQVVFLQVHDMFKSRQELLSIYKILPTRTSIGGSSTPIWE